MKKLVLFLAACSFSFSASAQTPSEAVTITANPAAASYRMTQQDFAHYKGVYDLSNGQTLALYNRSGQMYVELGDQERRTIVATGTNSFTTADKQLRMRIELQANGEVRGEVYMRQQTAGLTTWQVASFVQR